MSVDLFAMIESVASKVPSGVFKPLPAHRWDPVSVNGVHAAKVVDHGVSFDVLQRVATVFWTFEDLAVPGSRHIIRGTIDISGHAHIWIGEVDNPTEQQNARIAARTLFTWQGIKISIEMIFDLAGKRMDYRFDGVTWP